MFPIFTQPLGFIALAAIPILVVIYCLRQKLKKREISTLFLVPAKAREMQAGTRFSRWENVASFWWQVIAVLLVTWLLVGPRFIIDQSVAQVIIVLDESASMQAFKEKAPEIFARDMLPRLEKSAARIEWILCTDGGDFEPLYRGNSKKDLFEAWRKFEPLAGTHDALAAVEKLRNFFPGKNTAVVFVSDKIPEIVPSDTICLAVGEPFSNVGFSGFSISSDSTWNQIWRAGIQNYSDDNAEVSWELDGFLPPRKLTIPAHGNVVVQNIFPKKTSENSEEYFTLKLALQDAFPLDNALSFLRPQPRILRFSESAGTPKGVSKLIGNFKNFSRAPSSQLRIYTRVSEESFTSIPLQKDVLGEMVFLKRPENSREKLEYRIGEYTCAPDALINDLSWQGFVAAVVQKNFQLPPNSKPLLWQNNVPAIVLEKFQNGKTRLTFNLESSDWAKNDAAILLIHRYCESLRERSIDAFADNFECGEKLPLAGTEFAPLAPGFFEKKDSTGTLILKGTSHFADVREADFSHAESGTTGEAILEKLAERNSFPDPLRPLWILLVLGAALLGWRTKKSYN